MSNAADTGAWIIGGQTSRAQIILYGAEQVTCVCRLDGAATERDHAVIGGRHPQSQLARGIPEGAGYDAAPRPVS